MLILMKQLQGKFATVKMSRMFLDDKDVSNVLNILSKYCFRGKCQEKKQKTHVFPLENSRHIFRNILYNNYRLLDGYCWIASKVCNGSGSANQTNHPTRPAVGIELPTMTINNPHYIRPPGVILPLFYQDKLLKTTFIFMP